MNPVVTVAAATLGNTPLLLIPVYITGQLLGGLAGFGLLRVRIIDLEIFSVEIEP